MNVSNVQENFGKFWRFLTGCISGKNSCIDYLLLKKCLCYSKCGLYFSNFQHIQELSLKQQQKYKSPIQLLQ